MNVYQPTAELPGECRLDVSGHVSTRAVVLQSSMTKCQSLAVYVDLRPTRSVDLVAKSSKTRVVDFVYWLSVQKRFFTVQDTHSIIY